MFFFFTFVAFIAEGAGFWCVSVEVSFFFVYFKGFMVFVVKLGSNFIFKLGLPDLASYFASIFVVEFFHFRESSQSVCN